MSESAYEYQKRVMALEERWKHQHKYELLVDLSSYHPQFKAGVIGIQGPDNARGPSARGCDDFFPMQLQSGVCLDVLWKGVARADIPKAKDTPKVPEVEPPVQIAEPPPSAPRRPRVIVSGFMFEDIVKLSVDPISRDYR